MELIKNQWTTTDIAPFISYLQSFGQPTKVIWAKKILNTPSDVLAIPTKQMAFIAKQIALGNFYSFLDLKMMHYYESIALYGMLLSKIDDFKLMKSYLTIYLDMMDNWAHCDLLQFPHIMRNVDAYIDLATAYLCDDRIFVKRLGLFILFHLVKEERFLPIIFQSLDDLQQEQSYYVMMMAGWLLSECIILYRNLTLDWLSSSSMHQQIVNKGIQKCRESHRLSQDEKDNLLKYKKR